MLRIRLQRSGRKNRPNYRIVVAEHSAPIKGRYIEMLGTFDPLVEKHGLVVDTAKVAEWIKKGAKPTNTVARLLKGQGVKDMEPFIVEMKDRAIKNPKKEEAPAAPSAPAAEATGAEGEEKPAEETAPVEEKKEEVPVEEKKEETPEEEAPVEEKKEEVPVEEKKEEEPKEEEKPVEEPATEEPKEEAPAEEGSGEAKESEEEPKEENK